MPVFLICPRWPSTPTSVTQYWPLVSRDQVCCQWQQTGSGLGHEDWLGSGTHLASRQGNGMSWTTSRRRQGYSSRLHGRMLRRGSETSPDPPCPRSTTTATPRTSAVRSLWDSFTPRPPHLHAAHGFLLLLNPLYCDDSVVECIMVYKWTTINFTNIISRVVMPLETACCQYDILTEETA